MGDWKVCSVQSRQKKNQERRHLHWMKKVKTGNLHRGHFHYNGRFDMED